MLWFIHQRLMVDIPPKIPQPDCKAHRSLGQRIESNISGTFKGLLENGCEISKIKVLKKKSVSLLLTLETSKDNIILICIQILTTQSHSTTGTHTGFPLKIAHHFIVVHYADNCQKALDVRALSNRTEMVILKQYTFWRKYSGALNSIRKGKCKDKVSDVCCLELSYFNFSITQTCRKLFQIRTFCHRSW